MNINNLIRDADMFAREQMKLFNPDIEILYDLAMAEGIKLAEHYGANIDIVKIGCSFMDCKLPKSQKDGVPSKHIEMSAVKAKEMLEKYNIDDKDKINIVNCVEAHHGTKEYLTIEAEICANADCYKFVHPKGVFAYASLLGRRFNDLDKELEQLEYKLDEKYSIISLDKSKEELEQYYKQFKQMITVAKSNDF